jgi:gamma-glutamyl hydrolase
MQAGARVVPIAHDVDTQLLDHLLASLNGVLFTGGGLDLSQWSSPYMLTARHIFASATANASAPLPVWGTCMGMQLLSILAAQDPSVLDTYAFDSENESIPLNWSADAATSRLYSYLTPVSAQVLGTENVTANLHHDGVTPTTFATNARLKSFFRVLSTNVDRKGRAFVSTIEALAFPVFATQWHPERPQYEFSDLAINHSQESIRAMQEVC